MGALDICQNKDANKGRKEAPNRGKCVRVGDPAYKETKESKGSKKTQSLAGGEHSAAAGGKHVSYK